MTDAPETDASFLAPVSGTCVMGIRRESNCHAAAEMIRCAMLHCVTDVSLKVCNVDVLYV